MNILMLKSYWLYMSLRETEFYNETIWSHRAQL